MIEVGNDQAKLKQGGNHQPLIRMRHDLNFSVRQSSQDRSFFSVAHVRHPVRGKTVLCWICKGWGKGCTYVTEGRDVVVAAAFDRYDTT
jgi:hypothetical protein